MSRARRFAFYCITAVLVVVLMEGALRMVGFRRETAPVVLRFGYPNPREITDLFQPDPRLFWRLRPGSVFDAEGPVPINAAGYRGPVAVEPRPPELFRVAVLGDSVAFGLSVAWPELLQNRLEARFGGRPVEVLNFGVPGYSSVQGLRQLEDEVTRLAPDVVVIAYGWNDHWLSQVGLADEDRHFPSPLAMKIGGGVRRLRLVQAAHALLAHLPERPDTDEAIRRVPPATYRDQIVRLVREARSAGAAPIVLGLPSGLVEGEVPEYLVDMGFAPSPGDAIRAHREYVDLARSAAEEQDAPFVDLDPVLTGSNGRPLPGVFTRDGIHPSEEGHARIADALLLPVLERAAAGGAS